MIINSLLDQDFYKFSMMKIYLHKFNDIWAKYDFRCRNKDVKFSRKMIDEIKDEIENLSTLRFTEEELYYLERIPWLGNSLGFIETLRLFQLNENYIHIKYKGDYNHHDDPTLDLEITAEGPIWQVSMYEIFVLAIVNEVYFKHLRINSDVDFDDLLREGKKRLDDKINLINSNPFSLTEFGTRRRYSQWWQQHVLSELKLKVPSLLGTSNVYLANLLNLKPLGTMAHEYICLHQGLDTNPVAISQKVAFDNWMQEYQGELGIALSDTLGTERFLKDFNKLYANAFTGIRHDSGDPIIWGDTMIKHYENLGIDPKTKTLMFSDSLNFEKAMNIEKHFKGKCKTGYGIGTYLTNDLGVEPLNIVYKLTRINNKPVAKLSDESGKTFSDNSEYVSYLRMAIKS
jgi:nicotinate phosphoribosyltransferase